MTVQWTNRPAFIRYAAEALEAGREWEDILRELPRYATTYWPRRRPHLKPQLGRNQEAHLRAAVDRERRKLATVSD